MNTTQPTPRQYGSAAAQGSGLLVVISWLVSNFDQHVMVPIGWAFGPAVSAAIAGLALGLILRWLHRVDPTLADEQPPLMRPVPSQHTPPATPQGDPK